MVSVFIFALYAFSYLLLRTKKCALQRLSLKATYIIRHILNKTQTLPFNIYKHIRSVLDESRII